MSLHNNIFAFSSDGEYFAFSSPDGCLKIWETSTFVSKQEYIPSSHLSATCSCLSWGPYKQDCNSAKKAKKSKDNYTNIKDLQLISIGTLTGDILLYSYAKADLHSSLRNGHTNTVNAVSWCKSTHDLYSCSNDQHVIVWNVVSGKIRKKWKAGKSPLYSLAVIDHNNILTASNSITWWDVTENSVIKTFPGHASEIFRLLPSSGGCFMSASLGDRVLKAWQVNKDAKNKTIASFVLPGEPSSLDCIWLENEPFQLAAVTKDGSCQIFEHSFNGKSNAPLQPKFSIQFVSKPTKSSNKPCPVPVLAAYIENGMDECILVYGTFINLKFEKINLTNVESDLFLVRDISFSSISIEGNVSKVKQTTKPNNVKMLAPGHMISEVKKRKKEEFDITELPMEERLKAIDLGEISATVKPTLQADSMVHLLLQGLQSQDQNLLDTVLCSSEASLIQNTLERLPLNAILLLLKELHGRMTQQEKEDHPCLTWLKALLALHLPYLMSCKDIDEYLGPISQLIEARTENFKKMCQLRGCLKILWSQAASVSSKRTALKSKPLLEYQSDSSSEEADSIEEGEEEDKMQSDDSIEEDSLSSSSESEMEPEN